MPRYMITQSYASFRDGQRYGPWEAGGEIDLSEADAEWVNRDAPGTLEPPKGETEESALPGDEASPDDAEPRRQQKPARNRQHRGGANRGA